MPRRSVRTRKRTMGFLSFLIGLTAVAAVALVCAIVIRDRRVPLDQQNVDPAPTDGFFVDARDMPDSQVVLKADTFSEEYLPTPSPDPNITPTVTPASTLSSQASDPSAGLRPVAMGMDLLPIYKKAFTDQKVIAITLDECSGAKITAAFVKLAQKYGAKLTLFPTGENVMKNGMNTLLRQCVFKLGYEVENRGYSAMGKVYQYIDTLMVQEIWKQSVALNFALGVKYQPHFYRPYGGLGESDPRTHAYLKQQGYLGIAHWTLACSGLSASKIASRLTPGGVYLFKSTEEDGQRMYALMKAASEQGYRMVTMNELFGLPANTYQQVQGSLLAERMPDFQYDANKLYDVYPGDTAWAVAVMQSRLIELGYLEENTADGVFGEATSNGLRLFQAEVGRAASGMGDVATLQALYAEDAPANPRPLETPVPKSGGKSKTNKTGDDSDAEESIYEDDFQFTDLIEEEKPFESSDSDPIEVDAGNPFVDSGIEEE